MAAGPEGGPAGIQRTRSAPVGFIFYIVLARRSDIGICLALGATRGNIVQNVMRQALASSALGTILGVLLALVAARAGRSLLFELQPNDPLTFVAASCF